MSQTKVVHALRYQKNKFQERELRSMREKMLLAEALEVAILAYPDLDLEQVGLTEAQVNALLDWKQDVQQRQFSPALDTEEPTQA